MRHAISEPNPLLAAQPIDASVKIAMLAMNSPRMVSARVRNPVSGIAMISAIRYAVWIQLILSFAMASACWIVGSDVATTCTSSTAMNMPTHIAAKPVHVAGVTESVARVCAAAIIAYLRSLLCVSQPPNQEAKQEPANFHVLGREAGFGNALRPLGASERARDRNLSVMCDHRMQARSAAA